MSSLIWTISWGVLGGYQIGFGCFKWLQSFSDWWRCQIHSPRLTKLSIRHFIFYTRMREFCGEQNLESLICMLLGKLMKMFIFPPPFQLFCYFFSMKIFPNDVCPVTSGKSKLCRSRWTKNHSTLVLAIQQFFRSFSINWSHKCAGQIKLMYNHLFALINSLSLFGWAVSGILHWSNLIL